MFAKRFLGALTLTSIAALSMATISMTTNVKEGQSLSGSYKFEVRVTSDVLVRNVEFYIGDNLINTDDSTPYQFTLDTLAHDEGNLTIKFEAYNANGESAKQTYNIKVDNGLSKGVKFHVDESVAHARDGKYQQAIDSARIALKIDKNDNSARMAMARANYAAGIVDIAQKFAEDVLVSDANNADAKALLSAINLRRAFFVNSTNPTERNETVAKALKAAAEGQSSVQNANADAAGISEDLNVIDTNLIARRYSLVASTLRPNWEKNLDNAPIMNRFLYALVMGGRIDEARKVLGNMDRYGSPDGYTFAIKAIVAQMMGDTAGADAAEKEVILESPSGDITKYTQLYLALSRGKVAPMGALIADLEKNNPNGIGVNMYRSSQAFLSGNYSGATEPFQNALLSDPANVQVLIERGNQVLQAIFGQKLTGSDLTNQAGLALGYYEAASAAHPESYQALCAIATIHILNGDSQKALSFARAAVGAAPEYGGSYFVLAGALRLAQVDALKDAATRNQATAYRDQTEQALQKAAEFDVRLKGRFAPGGEQAWAYLYGNGRVPFMPLPPKS